MKNYNITESYEDGKLKMRRFSSEGKLCREPNAGPALEEWYPNGQIENRIYYFEGLFDRDDGPAHKRWYKDGSISNVRYYKKGKLQSSRAYLSGELYESCDKYII